MSVLGEPGHTGSPGSEQVSEEASRMAPHRTAISLADVSDAGTLTRMQIDFGAEFGSQEPPFDILLPRFRRLLDDEPAAFALLAGRTSTSMRSILAPADSTSATASSTSNRAPTTACSATSVSSPGTDADRSLLDGDVEATFAPRGSDFTFARQLELNATGDPPPNIAKTVANDILARRGGDSEVVDRKDRQSTTTDCVFTSTCVVDTDHAPEQPAGSGRGGSAGRKEGEREGQRDDRDGCTACGGDHRKATSNSYVEKSSRTTRKVFGLRGAGP
jgi:hypothetical protein